MTPDVLSARALVALLGDWEGGGAAYLALADRIRLLLIDGRILSGTRLPSERELAERLGRSRTTVVAAYSALRDTGHAASRRGSGTIVRLPAGERLPAPTVAGGELVDLGMACPPCAPMFGDYAAAASGRLAPHLGRMGVDFVGLPELRERIAARYTVRGLPTRAEQIVVTSGAQHAIGLLVHALLSRGDRVLVEAPSYPHAIEAFRSGGGRLVSSPVTAEEGWDAEQLIETVEHLRPAFAYTMPDFHNPTGASMPEALRRRLLEAASRVGMTLVVDETTTELDIDRGWTSAPFAALASSQEERDAVIMLGSLSKTLWSGVRIGWIRAEARHLDRIVAARSSVDLGVPVLEQLIAAEAVADLDTVLAHRREQLRDSRDALRGLLAARLPEFQVPETHGGLVVWAQLGAPMSSTLALAARSYGLRITAGPLFGTDGEFERFLRIPFTAPAAQLEPAIDALAAAWASIGRFRSADRPALTQIA